MKKYSIVSVIVSMTSLTLATLGAQAAFATSPHLTEMACWSENSGPDHGISVVIKVNLGDNTHSRTATVSEQTIAGPRTLAVVNNVKRIQSRRPGDALHYSGKNFELSILTTATPIDGHMRGYLTLDRRCGRVYEEMLCNFTR